jgi:SNF2 family DNA or RNA helicase
MSFLAQLRQQQTDTERGLKLCYLLEIQKAAEVLKLRLTLAELHQGQLMEMGRPYKIQRQHLSHPPPFISQTDINPLHQLVDANPNWLQQDGGNLPAEKCTALVPALLETQRCFIKTPQGHWQRLAPGNTVTVKLEWSPSHTGVYQLNWRTDATGKLICLDAEASCPVVYDANRGVLALTQHHLSDAALDAMTQVKRHLPASAIARFLSEHKERWTELELPLPEVMSRQELTAELNPVLQLSSKPNPSVPGGFDESVSLIFRYTSASYCACIPYGADRNAHDYWDGVHINHLIRDPQQEQQFQRQLLPYMARFESTERVGKWRSSEGGLWRQLLTESRPELEQQGFSFWVDPGFRHHYVVADRWQVEIEEAGNHFLQLSLLLELDGGKIDLLELLRQLQTFNREQSANETTLTLPDGRLLLLPAQRVSGIMDELGDLLAKHEGMLRLPRSQISRLDGLRRQLPEATQWQGAVEHLALAANLHETPALLDKIPDGVEAELRPYQWLGVCWLQHLKRHQVNGLLADDMGLGKTLQTLAHLSLERQHGHLQHPALIVAPTSLLHNWAAEIQRFTPQLRYKIVHGPKRQRLWSKLQDYDILISSYQLIVNDLSHWQAHKLSWIILDEAQQIKNPRTQVSQALRQLESDYRICLTGTPVQNHLGELWSLLDFLMPGCLGNLSDFRRHYQTPIEQEANEERMVQLQQRIAPFMLRRTKDQVAADLPEKTEIHQHISLADDQQTFYDEQKNTGKSELQQQLSDSTHSGQQQILLLTVLLKLRQVCCDPQLLGVSNISSAKREHCIAMLEELVEEKRAILLFSQFTSMLDLLAHDLDELGIKYLKLTGQSRNRQQLVEAFQRGDAPVFLISLKAGGVGLNLTRADTVIHYDPWWNMAAEQQATDRAHRIGQDKPVFVYKLITENTIEEKIAQLQQHKAQISHHINHQATISGQQFALKLEDLMALWQRETETT